ncbi:putative glutamine amidotransferasec [Clostridium ragsdalei P11]|uniref:Putative glutamine amidotransferasec n=1 Tax=Clostridium ragsdalei P11 TaxID=1353534 RepID=A0A1A6AIZ0_9CLOT|nr:gamma-glutamyl-gamma-aminobutyrate hydrolase family protein [Clostridium ragsdalei]OBR90040.1 putative glutamine amidotransferasec [Clostridium ragsdalei P11]
MNTIIGISGNILAMEGGPVPGMKRTYVNSDYVSSVTLAGASPIILPVIENEEYIFDQVKRVDGIIISGGYDVNPILYGEEPRKAQGFTSYELDNFNFKLIKAACSLKKPILGICRGLQIINVYFGGTLYQDLDDKDGFYIKHSQDSSRSFTSHTIFVKKDSILYPILGEKSMVNSFHHQGIKDLAKGFKVGSVAKDGVIESIEKTKDNFILGVQWHPEGLAGNSEQMLEIFKKLVSVSRNKSV